MATWSSELIQLHEASVTQYILCMSFFLFISVVSREIFWQRLYFLGLQRFFFFFWRSINILIPNSFITRNSVVLKYWSPFNKTVKFNDNSNNYNNNITCTSICLSLQYRKTQMQAKQIKDRWLESETPLNLIWASELGKNYYNFWIVVMLLWKHHNCRQKINSSLIISYFFRKIRLT